jgi:Ankyrin repeats (3 copies)
VDLKLAGKAASPEATRKDFENAYTAFGDAIRLAPWVPEYHLNEGIAAQNLWKEPEPSPYCAAIGFYDWYLLTKPTGKHADRARGGIAWTKAEYLSETCVRFTDSWFTPLLWAAEANDLEEARLLVSRGTDVNRGSLLTVAPANGNLEMVKFLVAHGADVDPLGRVSLQAVAKTVAVRNYLRAHGAF